jgi:hypothetical protein
MTVRKILAKQLDDALTQLEAAPSRRVASLSCRSRTPSRMKTTRRRYVESSRSLDAMPTARGFSTRQRNAKRERLDQRSEEPST